MRYKDIENEHIRQCCRQIMYIAKTQNYNPNRISGLIARYTDSTTSHGYNLKQKGITSDMILNSLIELDVYKQWKEKF